VKKLPVLFMLLFSFVTYGYADAFDFSSMKYPEIRDIKLISFSPEHKTATFEVLVYNPNTYKVPVKELTGNIYLNKQHVSTLDANSKKSLAPLATQVFTVPINVNTEALMTAANDVMLTGIADYRFKGYMMTPVGELPITESGQLTAEQILTLIRATLFAPSPKVI